MKKVFLVILSLCAFGSYAQIVPTTVNANITTEEKQSYSQKRNERVEADAKAAEASAAQAQARAAQAQARAATAAAMAPPNTDVLTPLSVDLSSFTHIAIIDTYCDYKSCYNNTADDLRVGPFTVVNPTTDKKRFRKDRMYLREEKNPEWLYFYYSKNIVGVDASRVITIRDYRNKVVYKSKNINVPFEEVISQILDF